MISRELQRIEKVEFTNTDDGPSVAEILSTIAIKEAGVLKRQMLCKQGKRPMRYGAVTYYTRTLETPVFGVMQIGEFTHGWTASLLGKMPEGIMWAGEKPEDETFIDFSRSLLSLHETTTDSTGDIVSRGIVAYIDTENQLIYDSNLNIGLPVVDEDFGAELRVVLEYGLEALFTRPKLRKILAAI